MISFSGATDFEDKDTAIDYLFVVHEKNVYLVYTEVSDAFIGIDGAYIVLRQMLKKSVQDRII